MVKEIDVECELQSAPPLQFNKAGANALPKGFTFGGDEALPMYRCWCGTRYAHSCDKRSQR
jgi:hypothetical protein